MRINSFTGTLLLVALAIGSASAEFGARISKRQSGVGQANGYFYPEPSPSFTLPPVAPPTTTARPAPPPPPPPPVQPVVVPTTPATSYIPPATQVSYIQCSGAQQCVSASVCASRPGGSVGAPSGTCQAGGTTGVCCNPAPPPPSPPVQPVVAPTTTTYRPPAPAPTTAPATSYIPPATQVSYITCSGAQQCVSASVCASRPGGSVGAPSGTCQAGGTTGVCCNPPQPPVQPVVVPTAAPAPSAEYLPPVVQTTTSRPGYDNSADANTGNQNILRPTTAAPSRPVVTTSRPQTAAVVDDEIAFWDFRESIPGDPETDYPILDKIPVTSFTCVGKLDGFYADVDTRCQVFHVCASIPDAEPIKSSFLCPNGTIFNQEVFVCQWWPDVDCATSSNFYNLNSNIGKVPESAAGSGAPVKISAAGGAATNNVAVSVAAPSYTAGGSVAASASASSASGYGAPAQGAAALATSYLAPPPAKGGY